MRHGKGARRLAVALGAVLALAACSGDDAGTSVDTTQAGSGGDDGGVDVGVDEEAPRGGAAGGQAATESADGESAEDDGGDGAAVEVGGDTAGRHVIREAHVSLASDDPSATVDAIGRAATDAGGFVAGTDLRREGGFLTGTVTVRVPSEEMSQALTRIEAAGAEVTSRQLSSRDVTGEVTDVESQLRNLRALETQLLELLAEARDTGDTEEVLRVFDRIRQTRDEIERLEGRRANLADLVSLATITVRVEPTPDLLAQTAPERDPEPDPWSLTRQVDVAWQGTVTAMQAFANFLVVAVVTVLPVVLVWALPIGLAILAWRRLRSRDGGAGPSGPSAERPGPPPPAPAHASVGSQQDTERD